MKIDNGALVAAEHGLTRSSKWPKVEKEILRIHPYCLACGPEVHYERGLQVHHARIPFHFAILLGRPDLELDPRNLIVLCENEEGVETMDHHILIGHGGDFRRYLPDAADLAIGKFHGWARAAIKSDPYYASLVLSMPPEWAHWTPGMKADAKADLDRRFPTL